MGWKDIIKSPFKYGKNQAKTFTDFDMHFGKGGTVDDVKRDLDVKERINKKKYLTETFDDAFSRMDMNEADLKDTYDYHKNLFRIWFSLGILALLVILTIPIHHRYIDALPALFFIFTSIGICYRSSYKCYCINKRAFTGLDKWKRSQQWIPKPFVFKDKNQELLYKKRLEEGRKVVRSKKVSSSSNKNQLSKR
jgi:hypothetical protein